MRRITTKFIVVFAFVSSITFAQNNTTNRGQNSGTLGNNNSFFGANSGRNTTANNNSFFGANSGRNTTIGNANVFIGRNSGNKNDIGKNNTFLGNASGFANTTGNFNTYLGAFAGRENLAGRRNVFLGGNAGRNATGNGNVFIGYQAGFNETGNNRLFIDNSDTATPLLYGDFSKDQLGVNTNTIPDGYNFAVGGSAKVDETIKAKYGIFEGKYNINDTGKVLQMGPEWKPGVRTMHFWTDPEGDEFGFEAFNSRGKFRHLLTFRDDHSDAIYVDNNFTQFFAVKHDNRQGQDKTILHLPKENSRMVIGDYANYLEDQGHKLIVKDGTAMIENAIYTNGRIAIGTTENDPGYALTVKGKVHVQEVKVDLLGVLAPDYVFYEDYKLKTLEEVQDYIKKEGHLPNIPSAAEMEKEGVNLKEMNLKLLEKVEELTLYTIAQEKAIKEQKETNKSLEERLGNLEKLLTKN